MSMPLERLEAEALGLPAHQRARLAQRLIESLDEEATEDPREVERTWKDEIERRLQEYHGGTVGAIPASEVIAEARARLRRDRPE